MPKIDNRLAHQFAVDAIPGQKDIDTLQNIVKRREKILYKTKLLPSDVNIAYVTNPEKASDINLSIIDKSTFLFGNRIRQIESNSQEIKSFNILTTNFEVTDIFTDPAVVLAELPLFYQHKISTVHLPRISATDLTLASNTKLLNVEILNTNKEPISLEELYIDYSQGIVYNNLISKFTNTDIFQIYYIRYSIKTSSGAINTYVVLLDNENIYKPAELDDLDEFLEIITDGRKVYLIEDGGSNIKVTLPVLNKYSIRNTETSRIQVAYPAEKDITNSWVARIKNGTFLERVRGNIRRYQIAEFFNQSFDPQAPIKKVTSESPLVIAENLIKLDHANIYEENQDLDLYVNVRINNQKNESISAYTTNPLLTNTLAANGQTYRTWNSLDQIGIKSIDHKLGLLEIQGVSLEDQYNIEVDYYYNATYYEYSKLDFNPTNNPDILQYRIAFILDDDDSSPIKTTTLYHLKINEDGQVVDSDWPDFDTTVTGYIDDGLPIYYEQYPEYLPVTGHYIFKDSFTVESTSLSRLDDFLILAELDVNESLNPARTELMDSRKRGGGFIDRYEDAILDIQPESQWYWDTGNWDGQPYPGYASFMVEIPVDLLQGAGGQLTGEQVYSILNKHVAAGVYTVKKAYGIDVTITGVAPDLDSITIGWTSYGY